MHALNRMEWTKFIICSTIFFSKSIILLITNWKFCMQCSRWTLFVESIKYFLWKRKQLSSACMHGVLNLLTCKGSLSTCMKKKVFLWSGISFLFYLFLFPHYISDYISFGELNQIIKYPSFPPSFLPSLIVYKMMIAQLAPEEDAHFLNIKVCYIPI